MEPFLNIFGCCNFTEAKICEACTVLLGNGLFLKNRMTQKKNKQKKTLNLANEKNVYLEYCSSLSVARLGRFWFKVYKV